MKQVTDLAIYDEMFTAEQAVIFMHAAWSVYSVKAKKHFERLEELASRTSDINQPRFTWWEIDVTEQDGEIWNATLKWLEPQTSDAHLLIWGGWGSVIWASNGVVVRSLVRPDQFNKLVERHRNAFD